MKRIITKFLIVVLIVTNNSEYCSSKTNSNLQPNKTQAVNMTKFWNDGDFLKPQTYAGHSSSGMYFAADFYYNNRNRPDIYKNSESAVVGRQIKAPTSGNVFLHLLDISGNGSGQFPLINAVQVFQGTAPIPQTCFSLVDSLGSTVNIDLSFVIDFNSNNNRIIFSHLQTDNSFFTSAVVTKIRSAVRKFYNRTAVGNPRRVAVSTGMNISTGGLVGTINRWGTAQDYHIHFQYFIGSGYSESSPYLGTVQDLSNSSVITIDGQRILDIPLEINLNGIYQYPAMPRRTFQVNDYIIVNTAWDGGTGANLRNTPGGTIIQFYSNNSIGQILNSIPQKQSLNSDYYIWYNVRFGTQTGWMAAIYFDKTTATVISQSSSSIPKEFELYQNFPNPFNPVTKIKFDLPQRADVEFRIFDIRGKTLLSVTDNLQAGVYNYDFDGSSYSNGTYFFNLKTEAFNKTIKLILNK